MFEYVTNWHTFPPHPPTLRGFGPQVGHPNLTVKALLPSNKTPNSVKRKTTSGPHLHYTSPLPSSCCRWLLSIKTQSCPIFTCFIQLAFCARRAVSTLAFSRGHRGQFLNARWSLKSSEPRALVHSWNVPRETKSEVCHHRTSCEEICRDKHLKI